MSVRLWPFLIAGALIGAIPATVMEILEPLWEPEVITAFGMPMLAGAMFGFSAWMIADHRHYWRERR